MKLEPSFDKLDHFIADLRRESAVEDFVKLRRKFCDFMTSLHAKILTPTCCDCYGYKTHLFEITIEPPHINSKTWRNDLVWEVGLDEEEVQEIKEAIRNDDFQLCCHECRCYLKYGQDDFYVESEFFEKYFDIPESTHKRPSKQLRRLVERLYGKKCYGCGKRLAKIDISNDHIVARIHGGLTSPLNLQILCRDCDNHVKGSRKTETINVHLTFLFRPLPSDAYEGVTW